jgi:hypothetical protein
VQRGQPAPDHDGIARDDVAAAQDHQRTAGGGELAEGHRGRVPEKGRDGRVPPEAERDGGKGDGHQPRGERDRPRTWPARQRRGKPSGSGGRDNLDAVLGVDAAASAGGRAVETARGYNSQWRTPFRRDYWLGDRLAYHVDAALRPAADRLSPEPAPDIVV